MTILTDIHDNYPYYYPVLETASLHEILALFNTSQKDKPTSSNDP
jgi:hypothetical protein